MPWRDNLRPAEFRKAPFKVLDRDLTFGRRTVTHEYPRRDKPYVEDLGRRSREFTLEAYVIGPEYMAARDALIGKLEQPGAGTLVHPTLGALRVTCTQARMRESSREGGMARFSLTFIEGGAAVFPSARTDTQAKTGAACDAALAEAQRSFGEVFDVTRRPAYVSESAQNLLIRAVTRIRDANGAISAATEPVGAFAGLATEISGAITQLVLQPAALSASITGLMGAARSVASSPRGALDAYRGLLDFGNDLDPAPSTTPNRAQQQRNQDAIVRLVRQSAVIEATRGTADAEFESYDQAALTRDQVGDDLDAIMAVADDALYARLTDLRAAMVADINRRGADLARIRKFTPGATVPALLLSYRLYGTPERAAELVTRNRVRHPGFVPGGDALEVLSDA